MVYCQINNHLDPDRCKMDGKSKGNKKKTPNEEHKGENDIQVTTLTDRQ